MEYLIKLFLLLVTQSVEIGVKDADLVGQRIPNDAIISETEFRFTYSGNTTESCTYIDIDARRPILIVGDSRTVGMHKATNCNDFSYLSRGSMGYNWLVNGTDSYVPNDLIACCIEANPDCSVVFNLGVNDLCNKSKYVAWINNFSAQYPDTSFYYLSVNPVLNRADLNVLEFNDYVESNISKSVVWLDSYSYLEKAGFNAVDGIHYDADTYNVILQFVESKVEY